MLPIYPTPRCECPAETSFQTELRLAREKEQELQTTRRRAFWRKLRRRLAQQKTGPEKSEPAHSF